VVGLGSVFTWPRIDATFDDMTVLQSPFLEGPGKRRWAERQKRIYDDASVCLVTSPWAADSVIHDYGIPESKVAVVGFGSNVTCEPVPKDWERPRLLWVGVDWHRKGGDILLEAFSKAAIPGARLDLVGHHPAVDVPNVRGHGVVRNTQRLRALFEQATLFVLPSRFEPYGIVFIEAASAGTPVLGTDTGGARYSVGPSGETVPPNDVDALVHAIRRMTDPQIAGSYVLPAIAHARQHTWDAVALRVIEAVTSAVPDAS